MKHLPNALTIGRIILTPVFIALILKPEFWYQFGGWAVFIFAAISDWLDGKLARHYQVSSRLGKFLDPLADKILVLSAFVVLPLVLEDASLIPWWGVALILIRDVFVTALRMYSEYQGRSLVTLPMARTKTAFQLTFLISVMTFLVATKNPWVPVLADVAAVILYSPFTLIFFLVVVALTVYTGLFYLIRRPQTQH